MVQTPNRTLLSRYEIKASPLVGYLAPGAVVTKLNDHALAATQLDLDPWSTFLKSPKNDEMNLGWCVDMKDLGTLSLPGSFAIP